MGINGIAWAEEKLGILPENSLRAPYIPSPDWSKDKIVPNDPLHGTSKFLSAAGIEALTGVGIAKLNKLRKLGKFSDGTVVKAPSVARTITKIGDLTKEEAAALRNIWQGGPRSQLPLRTREQLAELYSGVAKQNPAGYAQSAFNQARADYLLGRGPNPGTNVNDFAARMGLPIFRGQ